MDSKEVGKKSKKHKSELAIDVPVGKEVNTLFDKSPINKRDNKSLKKKKPQLDSYIEETETNDIQPTKKRKKNSRQEFDLQADEYKIEENTTKVKKIKNHADEVNVETANKRKEKISS